MRKTNQTLQTLSRILLVSSLMLQSPSFHSYLYATNFKSIKIIKISAAIDFIQSASFKSQLISHEPVTQTLSQTKLIITSAFYSNELPQAELFYKKHGTNNAYISSPFTHFTKVNKSAIKFKSNSQAASSSNFIFVGSAQIPREFVETTGLDYYIQLKINETKMDFFRSAEKPQYVSVQTEICSQQQLFTAPNLTETPRLAIKAGAISMSSLEGAFNEGTGVGICSKLPSALPSDMRPKTNQVSQEQPVAFIEITPDTNATDLKKPVTLSLDYNDFDSDNIVDDLGIPVDSLKWFWWDGFEWRMIGGKADPDTKKINVKLSHFSIYALFATTNELSFRPQEKIITPATKDGINDFANFDGLSGEDFTIKIFDITGREIRSIKDITIWDGKNDFGQIVESGAYVYQVHVQGKIISGVIAVAK